MPWIEWYNSLAKPSWTPAPATIGLIWQILFPIILASLPWLMALPFAINLVANRPLEAVYILIVWATIIWMVVAVSLATVLQLSITAMNWGNHDP